MKARNVITTNKTYISVIVCDTNMRNSVNKVMMTTVTLSKWWRQLKHCVGYFSYIMAVSFISTRNSKWVHLYFVIPYYITILCIIFDSKHSITYSFWCPTKTINFVGCSWLIDIKYVRTISYICFCPKSNGIKLTNYTFLASSQLTTSIHWPCLCCHSFLW